MKIKFLLTFQHTQESRQANLPQVANVNVSKSGFPRRHRRMDPLESFADEVRKVFARKAYYPAVVQGGW